MLRFCGYVARCDEGYAWEVAGDRRPSESEERFAKRRLLKPLGAKFTNWFDPFADEPALFRIFAKLPPTEDAILAFANKYGDMAQLNEEAQVAGNSLWDWRQATDKFRDYVEFADSLLPGTTKAKRKETEAIATFIEPLLMTFPVFMSAVIANGAVDLRGNVFDLTSVLTMQLIESVIERKSYRSCDHCGKPYELTPQINRADRIFCSDNCRVKAYQRRRKQAIAMRAKGTSLREIAKLLNSDVPTVKRWVGETKKEK